MLTVSRNGGRPLPGRGWEKIVWIKNIAAIFRYSVVLGSINGDTTCVKKYARSSLVSFVALQVRPLSWDLYHKQLLLFVFFAITVVRHL